LEPLVEKRFVDGGSTKNMKTGEKKDLKGSVVVDAADSSVS